MTLDKKKKTFNFFILLRAFKYIFYEKEPKGP